MKIIVTPLESPRAVNYAPKVTPLACSINIIEIIIYNTRYHQLCCLYCKSVTVVNYNCRDCK